MASVEGKDSSSSPVSLLLQECCMLKTHLQACTLSRIAGWGESHSVNTMSWLLLLLLFLPLWWYWDLLFTPFWARSSYCHTSDSLNMNADFISKLSTIYDTHMVVFFVLLGPVFTSHSPLLIFLLVLSDAVQQAAGDEGHGHEEDDGRAHDGGQNGNPEPEVLITRERWRAREGRWLIYGCYYQVMPWQNQTFVIAQHQEHTSACFDVDESLLTFDDQF